jgi:hypothetical protein
MTLGDDSALPLKVSRRAVNFLISDVWKAVRPAKCPIYDTSSGPMNAAMQVTQLV